eukprot:2963-Chlamydomonas_euryale.AAC.1
MVGLRHDGGGERRRGAEARSGGGERRRGAAAGSGGEVRRRGRKSKKVRREEGTKNKRRERNWEAEAIKRAREAARSSAEEFSVKGGP